MSTVSPRRALVDLDAGFLISSMVSHTQLLTLVAVVRTGSFADAARELGYTGSAVSQQISALERSTKLVLFDRAARSVTPTPAAQMLVDRARDLLAAMRDLEHDVLEMAAGQLGTLRVGSFPTASESLLPVAFRYFLQSHPQVSLQLGEAESDELIGQLLDGVIDVTLVYHYDLVPRVLDEDLARVPLIEEDLLLLVPESHRLANEDSVVWTDLEDETWITTREETAGAESLHRLCASAGFAPHVGFQSNDYDVVREFVRSGLGVALVPALCGGATAGTRALASDHTVHRHVSVLHRGMNLNPVVPGFLDALRKAVPDISTEHIRPDSGRWS